MVPTTLGLAHVSPWIATRRSLTLRSSQTFLIGGATTLVLMMSGMATPALRANLDTRHSPWTVVGSMVRSKRRNAQVRSYSTDSGWGWSRDADSISIIIHQDRVSNLEGGTIPNWLAAGFIILGARWHMCHLK